MTATLAAPVLVRDTSDNDLAAIHAIYTHHVCTGLGSFEETPPDLAEMARRRAEVLSRRLPYLAAEIDGRLVGYAYAGPYRPRSAYRFSVEDSVYVAPDIHRRGVARALLAELIERCTALGYRQMIAVIGDSANRGSIGLHASMGFREAGRLHAIGFKLGRWVDSVLMQRTLGPGDSSQPV
jgi:L-amino acid N-acyltransferase YncA